MNYQDVLKGWNAAAANESRKHTIHPSGYSASSYFESGSKEAEVISLTVRNHMDFGTWSDVTCIEYGAGDGRISKHVSGGVKKLYHVDASYRMLQEARENNDIENIEYVLSVDNLFGISDRADFAYSYLCFQHNTYEDCIQIMKSINDNLKPGGLFLLQVPVYEEARFAEHWTDTAAWTEDMMRHAAGGSGFTINRLYVNHGAMDLNNPGSHHFSYHILRKTAE